MERLLRFLHEYSKLLACYEAARLSRPGLTRAEWLETRPIAKYTTINSERRRRGCPPLEFESWLVASTK